MTVYAITDTKKGRTRIAPTYLQTTQKIKCGSACESVYKMRKCESWPTAVDLPL